MFFSEPTLKIILSSSILLFGYFLFFWNFPEKFFFRKLLTPLTKYIRWAGLDNTWSLFAPNPLSQNLMVGFELEYANGKRLPWLAKEFSMIDADQHVQNIRFYRAHRQLVAIFNKVFSKSLCRFILRDLAAKSAEEPLPIRIHIIRYYEPETDDIKEILPWLSHRVYTYDVNANSEAKPNLS